MYRWRLADEPLYPDRFGDFHDDRAQMREVVQRGGGDEWRLLRCPVCHKTLDAKADCQACGDETDEVAA